MRLSSTVLLALTLVSAAGPLWADTMDEREKAWTGSVVKGLNQEEGRIIEPQEHQQPKRQPEQQPVALPVPADNVHDLLAGQWIYLDFKSQPELSGPLQVSDDGMLELPMVGSVKVAGLKVETARRKVWHAYADGYFVDPRLSLDLMTGDNR